MSGGHEHCTLAETQCHCVQSYVKKYLLGQAGEPAAIEPQPGYTFDRSRWIDWVTPRLN